MEMKVTVNFNKVGDDRYETKGTTILVDGRYESKQPARLVDTARIFRILTGKTRKIEGQRLLVEAMQYLTEQDPIRNRDDVLLLSNHFSTCFHLTDYSE